MERLDARTWHAVSPYLDAALDLPDADRPAWLAALSATEPEIAAMVARFLDDDRALQGERFLEDAPDLVAAQGLAGTTLGDYQLLEPLGVGGMGSVWRAARRDGRYEGQVAIKLLNAGLLGHAVQQRFTREGSILASLSHAHIAHLIDAGVTAIGQPYLVLEYVPGVPIDVYCERHQLPLGARVRLFLDVVAAVAHAHANLIVHRDLKPSNVLVTAGGRVKLLDFGIAKLLTDEDAGGGQTQITRDGGGALTPAYAAPEQLTGGAITTATDVYALGLLLYVLLTGRHPFAEALSSPAALLEATTMREPPPPGRHADLDLIVARALAKDPAERYASVAALGDDLQRSLNHQPISARADSLSYRAVKFVRRNRMAVSLASVAVVALLGGLVGTVSQARRATAQADLAAAERDFAMRQLARAEAMNDLNNFVLTEATPSGTSFTLGDLLATAEKAIAQQHAHDADTRVDMMVAIGRQYFTQDEFEHSRRVLAAAYQLSSTIGDASARARAACAYGATVSKFGDDERAEGLISEGLAQLPDRSQYTLARVFCYLRGAEHSREMSHAAAAVERAETASRLLGESQMGSPLLRLRVSLELAESYRVASRSRAADAVFSQAVTQLAALGYERTEAAETLFNNWALVAWELGRPSQAEGLYLRAITISSADGTDVRVSPFVMNNLARTLIDLARYDEALQWARRAFEKSVVAGNQVTTMQSLLSMAIAYRLNRDVVRAGEVVRDIESRAATLWRDGHPGRISLSAEQGDLAAARGDYARATDLMTVALQGAERLGRDYWISRARLRRASLYVAQGMGEPARADAARALEMFQGVAGDGKSLYVARAALVHARALHLLGRHGEAHQQLAHAADHFTVVAPAHPEAREIDQVRMALGRPR